MSRGVTREGHEGRAHPPKNFDFGFWTERGETIAPPPPPPSAVFLNFAECRPQLKTRRSLLQAIIGSAEALPILCVSDFCDRERERERERETPVTSLISR